MKILVVGAGAVGGYYGTLLAEAGHAVTFVARGEHGRAIRDGGLHVEAPGGEHVARADVIADVKDAPPAAFDLVIVAVKADALAEVSAGVGRALAQDGVALPLLNGLDSETELAAVVGKERVVGGIAQIAARIVAPGRVRADAPGRLVLGPLFPEQMPRVEALAATLSRAGFGCDAKNDLSRVLWTKLLWNAPFNAVCALTRKSAGEVLAVPELALLVERAMHELAAVARAEGVPIDDALIQATLAATRAKFAGSIPSMLQDVMNGRPTEARALQGAVIARGRVHGISTPIFETLFALVVGLR
ncbi:MAG TPA: 2-dehydropantoate 2-reductase [Polyangiaceae bacterium]|nr:2-dehydropantoate 2-reductase [Polyangiaceae bacterium]